MGLLDQFSNLNPEQTQGLLAAAAQMLQQSGPSLRPTSFGQALGGGLMAYQGSMAESQRRKQEDEMRQLQMRDMQGGLDDRARARQQEEGVADAFRNAWRPPGGSAALPPGGPTMGNTAPNPQTPTGFDQEGLVQSLMAINPRLALEMRDKFAPKPKSVKEWGNVRKDGKVLRKPYFDDGTAGDEVDAEVAEKLNFQDTGGKTLGLNSFTGAIEAAHTNSQSPNNKATVGASYANAAATRDVAAATRDAATIRRDQETEMKLGDDYRTQSKGFKDVSDAYRSINATLDKATTSPAATLAGATKFMKLLDPGSVVRESELGMAMAASGVLDRATNYHNVLMKGRVLTPTQVADFKNITKQIYTAAQQGQQAIDQSYRAQAETYGLRPEMVVQELGQSKPAAPTMAAMPKANASNKNRTLVDNETGKRYRSNGMQWVEVK